jgi:branched-chain amino acid aminotransferase
MQVSLNGAITDDASISALSAASLYGKGVFTTLAIRDGEPFLWDRHWKRLTANAAKLSIDVSKHPELSTHSALLDLVSASELTSGRARLTFLDESIGPIWRGPGKRGTLLLMIVAEVRSKIDHLNLGSSSLVLNSRSPLAGIKSCNYLEHLMAIEAARELGFDEAIRLNENGHVSSACMANVFWEKGGRLFTPSLSTGCLPGTTREFVLENSDCEEVESRIEVLESADRIFLTSAGLGVAPVAEFNERKLDTSDHPLLNLIPN